VELAGVEKNVNRCDETVGLIKATVPGKLFKMLPDSDLITCNWNSGMRNRLMQSFQSG
jgi:hypothetical protein